MSKINLKQILRDQSLILNNIKHAGITAKSETNYKTVIESS